MNSMRVALAEMFDQTWQGHSDIRSQLLSGIKLVLHYEGEWFFYE